MSVNADPAVSGEILPPLMGVMVTGVVVRGSPARSVGVTPSQISWVAGISPGRHILVNGFDGFREGFGR